MSIEEFQELIWQYYHEHGRRLMWREPEAGQLYSAYKIWVSEIMLQQTQVSRVLPKYEQFLVAFPTVQALADAELSQVLQVWNGLGYNRRAKFLWLAAQEIVKSYGGAFPRELQELTKLPGIGPNTAAAILVYAYNQPHVFIETNIRSVYIHHFFNDADQIEDKQLLPLIEASLDREHPREWYWAIMDYGSHLKRAVGNASRASKHYTKQSAFQGSVRQIRGYVIRELTAGPKTLAELQVGLDDTRLPEVVKTLTQEGLVKQQAESYML